MNTRYWKRLIIAGTPLVVGTLILASCSNKDTSNKATTVSQVPEKAQILDCVVRPATPAEISQGAHFGLTMRAVAPLNIPYHDATPIPTPELNPESPGFVLAGLIGDPSGGMNRSTIPVVNKTVSTLKKSTESDKPDSIEVESTVGLRWRNSAISPDPLPVSVSFVDDRHFSPAAFQPLTAIFKLKTNLDPLPNPSKFRKENFKVTRATLLHNPYSPTIMQIKLYFDNVTDEGNGLATKPQSFGYWSWGDKKPFYRFATVHHAEYTASNQPSSVMLTIEIENLRLPPAKGTKIHGLVSVSNGWPQDISVECPPKLPTKSTEIDLKFSTKLAPLPRVDESAFNEG